MIGLRKKCVVALMTLFWICGMAGMVLAEEGKVDVNRAGVEELMQIKGIGRVLAEGIVAERTANGPYTRVEDLLRVKGIGPKSLEKIRESIMVSTAEGEKPS